MHDLIEAVASAPDETARNERKRALCAHLSSTLGIAEDDILATSGKGSQIGANRLWQGEMRSRRLRLAVAIPADGRADPVAEGARRRLAFDGRGFDAVAIAAERAGTWAITDVVEYEGGTVAEALRGHFSRLDAHTVARPFVPPAHAPPTAEMLDRLAGHLSETANVVLQGPPGTGKTFLALEACRRLAGASDLASCQFSRLKDDPAALASAPLLWELVQLHPGYAYEDFVRGLATGEGEGLRFVARDRILCEMALAAARRGEKPTVLVLDEINRCNLAAVLGEALLVIEDGRRGEGVRLQHGEGLLVLPPSLKIIGTMNTADRSIALIDFAIRRRFRFVTVPPSPAVIAHYYGDAKRGGAVCKLFDAANAGLDADCMVGHSYFLVPPAGPTQWTRRMANQVAYEVVPLLREYQAEGRLPAGHAVDLLGDPCPIDASRRYAPAAVAHSLMRRLA
ncbi:MAG: AAA family ATPase [Gemmataceae bacterium]|nr:AAA family ATPase [Gemmataceae bacterium]